MNESEKRWCSCRATFGEGRCEKQNAECRKYTRPESEKVSSPSAALPVAVDHEDTAEARTDYPRGQALEMLLEDLRGHARWLALKGYDHFAKQIHWAANIIEGLSDD